MKEADKEIRKKYERIGKIKADVGVMPRAFTTTVYALIILAVLGLLASMLFGASLAMWGAAVCMLAVILMYFIASRRGPVRYTEVMVKHEGKYLLFQVINEKNVIFTDGEYTLEYKKKEVKERPEGILHPELSYNAPLAAEFTAAERKGSKTIYTGEADGEKGRKAIYKVSVEGKLITGFTRNGKKVLFDCINDRGSALGIPAALADEILKRGTVLPKNDIFLSRN